MNACSSIRIFKLEKSIETEKASLFRVVDDCLPLRMLRERSKYLSDLIEARVNQRFDAFELDSNMFPHKFSSSSYEKSAIVSGNSYKSLFSSDSFLLFQISKSIKIPIENPY